MVANRQQQDRPMARNAHGFELASHGNDVPHTVSLGSPFAAGVQGDPATVLSPESRRRFRLLSDAAADADAIGRGYAVRLVDLVEARQRAVMRLAQVRAQRVGDEHPEAVSQQAIIADADGQIERLNERVALHNTIAGPRRELLNRTTDWLRSAAGHGFADVELVDPPKLLKGETTPEAAIPRLRRRLRELSADAARVEASPYPLAVAAKVAEETIRRRAVAPVVSSLVEHAGPLTINGQRIEDAIVFPTKMAKADVTTMAGPGVAIGEQVDVVGLLCWLFPKEMTARIVGELRADSDAQTEAAALTHEQRREQLAVIQSDKDAVEAEEHHWLWAAFAAGTVVEPRADASPSAFLGVALARAEQRAHIDHADGVASARAAESRP
jgi:hypothetical protein